MTEIKKLTKIALIVEAVIFLIFGTMQVFLYDMTLNTEGWTNPFHVRAFGGILYVAALFAIIMLRKTEWEEIKLAYIFLFSLCFPVLIVEAAILAVLGSTFMAATVSQMIFDLIIISGKVALGIVAYFRQ
ncbi:hypothetical protein EU527_18780 [Candidatus Thorarchaeota archaeon]|nr:MAG: hypothetical protein EU527_18780 [Candidatus Thorarchaeota archaeon]